MKENKNKNLLDLVQWPNFFQFFFNFFFYLPAKAVPKFTFQQIFYPPKRGSHSSGEHTTTCWNRDRILPLQHTKLNYLWLSQSPPGNEGKCQDQNLAGVAVCASRLLREVFNMPWAARDRQSASHTEACTAPSPWLCTFSRHCPDLILKGGQFNGIISLVLIKPKAKLHRETPEVFMLCPLPTKTSALESRSPHLLP